MTAELPPLTSIKEVMVFRSRDVMKSREVSDERSWEHLTLRDGRFLPSGGRGYFLPPSGSLMGLIVISAVADTAAMAGFYTLTICR